MNGHRYRLLVWTAAMCLVLGGSAWAQTGTTGSTGQAVTAGTSRQMGSAGVSGGTVTADPQRPDPDRDHYDSTSFNSEWIASGFVGGNFGQNSLSSSVDFGGTLGYLYRGIVGAEFLAGFSPRFKLDRLLTGDSNINNYMANAIVAVPVGALGGFRPFVSGGIGAITMSLNDNAVYPFGPGGANPIINTSNNNSVFDPNAKHLATNIGGGVMAFAGRWGVRGDVRYFSAVGTSDTTTVLNTAGVPVNANGGATLKDNSLLNDVSFWRANIGIAVRW
jgi:hypothetical protein